ncbi:hypothetical protein [Frigoriglobus tundricola]|uniref:Uncharacterized protein n=1 Tax=Frigoriglobus tundricola TaxID=2774151 RepID=A0A6M5YZA2_9BACT|nr:hypothetical protein [Frigoriglobus tundricola]QJW98561.1 hypothetical protein FTUN_6156 [Frigoriglobus tundricola]
MRFAVILLLTSGFASGCTLGPRALEKSHGKYNESFARVDAEELLLNIVRLRYDDPPAEVEVSAIAAQYELAAQAEARPFFAAPNPAGSTFHTFTTVLPFAGGTASSRPTLSLTPIQSGETVARYLRPVTLDGLIVLAETSWPISTILRLWLEGVNGLPNAPSASGPTRSFPPEYQEFLRATQLLQVLQDRGELTFRKVEVEVPGDPIPAERVSGADLVEARKLGDEYRLAPDGKSWRLVRRVHKLYLDLSPNALNTPEYLEALSLLHLKPGLTRYEVTQSTVGFIEKRPDAPPSEKLNLVPRSLVQVLFYISHGVEVPPEHLAAGLAKPTLEPDGRPFDWRQLTDGLFTVRAVCQKKRPACAAVAVYHRGYWFYIDDTDHATKSTLSLLRPARRLDLGAVTGDRRPPAGPTLTLPVGR